MIAVEVVLSIIVYIAVMLGCFRLFCLTDHWEGKRVEIKTNFGLATMWPFMLPLWIVLWGGPIALTRLHAQGKLDVFTRPPKAQRREALLKEREKRVRELEREHGIDG